MESAVDEVNQNAPLKYDITFNSSLVRQQITRLEGLNAVVESVEETLLSNWKAVEKRNVPPKFTGKFEYQFTPTNSSEPNGPCIWIRRE
jgi:hypothetical protein